MEGTIQKWGNSLALRLPRQLTQEAGLSEGSAIDIIEDQGRIIITPKPRTYKLEELLQEVRDDNRHDDYSSGKPQGREIW
ncbi:MAG: hypothetical protein RL095_2752 [Verrucomicrobiota bacterium]|jgi:antitoxin MazE